MKRKSSKRLTLERERVRMLVELSAEQRARVAGGYESTNTSTTTTQTVFRPEPSEIQC